MTVTDPMVEAAALKACPFCGGKAALGTLTYSPRTVRENRWDQATFHRANCVSCGAMTDTLVGALTPAEAAMRWNARAALSAALPEGWVLVPAEATRAMLKAAGDYGDKCAIENYGGRPDDEGIWDAMLAAAPQPNGEG